MKKKSMLFVAALSIVGSTTVFAANDDVNVAKDEGVKTDTGTISKTTDVNVKEVSLDTLQKQVDALQRQIANLKKHRAGVSQKVVVLENHEEIVQKQKEGESAEHQGELQQVHSTGLSGSTWNKLFAYGPSIVTTPIVGDPDYAGYDLYINKGSVNEDMDLMKRRQDVYRYYEENKLPQPDRPVIALSGEIEGQAWLIRDYGGGNTNDVDLTTVALEAVANVNEWVAGMVKFTYLDLSPSDHDIRANTGNVFVDRAYITVGNTDKFPLFASVGQMKIPFVFDSSYTVTDTVTKNLGKMVERPLVLGLTSHGFYGKLYAFKGDVYKDSTNNVINNWGGTVGYKGQLGSVEALTVDIAAGAIRDLADALGLQGTGNSVSGEFQGFGSGDVSKRINAYVPAVSAHAIVHYADMIDFVANYVGAVDAFDERDMTFDYDGAKPQAIDLELQYNFDVLSKPSSVGIAFDRTWQALAANLPKYSYFVFASTSLFKRTVQAIEWRHDVNYNDFDNATGAGLPVTADGKHQDTFTVSFQLYF